MARSTTPEEEYKRLRAYLSEAFKGPNVDAVLQALAQGSAAYLVNNIQAVHDQVYITTAVDRYLDQRLADYNLIRPPNVGLGDDVFRGIGISVINKKQIRDLIMDLLSTMFGDEATKSTSKSSTFEPYALQDNDTLLIEFDGLPAVTVMFSSAQFSNINQASAQEVADAITRELRRQGKTGAAFAKDDGNGAFVTLISDTSGPSSTIRVLGGRAQNELKFDKIRPTSGNLSTQWTIDSVSGGNLRFTWSAGADPSLGKVRVNDYANIYGSSFDFLNQGTFTITSVKGGTVGNAFFEINNPNGVSEIVLQGSNDGLLFFNPFLNNINTKSRFAAVYQTESRLLEIFIPATTKVVRRSRTGAAHIHGPETFVTETYNPGLNEITDLTLPAPGTLNDGDYFYLNTPTNEYLVYFDTSGLNLTVPSVLGKTNIRVVSAGLGNATQLAQAAANILNGYSDLSSAVPVSSTLRVCNLQVGDVADATNVSVSGLVISIAQQGIDESTTTTSTPNPDEDPAFRLNNLGPYIYDPTQPFTISDISSESTLTLSPSTGRVITVSDSSSFPDASGLLIIGYGTSHQEGPVPYLSRPSSQTLLINPSYRIQNNHPVGTDVSLVATNGPVQIATDGSDYPTYITDVVSGRLYAEELINTVVATGIRVNINIIYPSDEGLSKWGTVDSDKVIVWGE